MPPSLTQTIHCIFDLLFSFICFTVGPGISPGLPKGSRALPPVGNFTQPQRNILFIKLFIVYSKLLILATL